MLSLYKHVSFLNASMMFNKNVFKIAVRFCEFIPKENRFSWKKKKKTTQEQGKAKSFLNNKDAHLDSKTINPNQRPTLLWTVKYW